MAPCRDGAKTDRLTYIWFILTPQATKTYFLSPSSSLKIATTQGPPETSFEIDPKESALVVVDMQNFFLSERCMEHPNGLAAVEPTGRVVEKCREVGIQVL